MSGNLAPTENFTVGYAYKITFWIYPVAWRYRKGFPTDQIQESERNVLRFHWVKNSHPSIIEVNRFTHLVFDLTYSTFVLESTLKKHFQYYISEYLTFIEATSEDVYVDGLVSSSNTIEEIKVINQKSIEFFQEGGFNLHKCHSNRPSLQSSNKSPKMNLLMPKRMADLAKILIDNKEKRL